MSIRRRSSFVVRPDRRRRPAAFSLVELLVVVAIIAMLLAILMPSLRCAREQARAASCAVMLRSMGVGLSAYAAAHNDWIPGVNTSGVAVRALRNGPLSDYIDPTLPAQNFDWITPWLRLETEVGSSPADKYDIILNRYSCPSQRGINAVIFREQGVPNVEEFRNRTWTALSYLMPVHFQYWGRRHADLELAPYRHIARIFVRPLVSPENWEVTVDDYRSRLPEVGRDPARKVAAADGTRYLDRDAPLDFDVVPNPEYFGSFTSAGGWWTGSTAYGVRPGSLNWDGGTVTRGAPARGQNLELSYRHGCEPGAGLSGAAQDNRGAINALFFDGHVSLLDDRRSREPTYWYPSGGVVRRPSEGMTHMPLGSEIP